MIQIHEKWLRILTNRMKIKKNCEHEGKSYLDKNNVQLIHIKSFTTERGFITWKLKKNVVLQMEKQISN